MALRRIKYEGQEVDITRRSSYVSSSMQTSRRANWSLATTATTWIRTARGAVADLIHWLHLTDDDLSQARRIIAAFKEDDTIDALGFLRISERFDDWCYPAVTTPMTRARYYLFVPAIYRALERQQLGLRELRDGAESMQHQLRRILVKTERPRNGVIGERADDKIRRLPSALYWSSLTTLSLLARRADGRSLSEAAYLRAATSRASDSDEVETDEASMPRGR